MIPNLKPWLVLAVIFIAGIGTGFALHMVYTTHFMRPPEPRDMKKHLMEFLTHRLNLTADQQAKIQPILADADAKFHALHHEEIERGAQIFKATDDQIAEFLTPDQKVALQKIEADREKAFPWRPHPWGGGGMFPHDEGPGNPPPPPPPPVEAAPPPSSAPVPPVNH